MKKLFYSMGILFIIPLMNFAQKNLTPLSVVANISHETKIYDLFNLSENEHFKEKIKGVIKKSTILSVNKDLVNEIILQKPEFIKLNIPIGNEGEIYELELAKVDLFASGVNIKNDAGQSLNHLANNDVHYRGIIKGKNKSIAAISISNNEIMGLISDIGIGNIVIGKLDDEQNDEELHVIYCDLDLLISPPELGCSDESSMLPTAPSELTTDSIEVSDIIYSSTKCVQNYLVVDKDIYDNKGAATTSFITGIFNQVATLYANDSVNSVISEILIHTTTDPYVSYGSTSATMLDQFAINLGTSFPGDIAHLLSYKANGGRAYVNSLCVVPVKYRSAFSSLVTSYSSVPTYSWNVMVVTHESGHNLGSKHTQACVWNGDNTAIDGCSATEPGPGGTCPLPPIPTGGGTIMSYCHATSVGINFSLGFGPQPGALIRSRINSSACLNSCSSTPVTCGVPTSLNATSITTTSAIISFTAVTGATNYTLQYKPVDATTWTSVGLLSSPYTLTGLTEGTTYEYKVATNCGITTSDYTPTDTFTINPCSVPSSLTTTSITGTTAGITFDAVTGATDYILQYKTATASAWTSLTLTTTSHTLTGLLSGTNYQYRVATNCSGTSTPYSAINSFTTSVIPPCNTPTSLSATSITTSSAEISFSPVSGAVSYTLQYKKSTTSVWTSVSLTSTTHTLTGLSSGTLYQYRVATMCSEATSAYSSASTFTTVVIPPCTAPTSLASSSITTSSAVISFAAVSGAASYTLQYKTSASTTWTSVTLTTTSHTLTGLAAGTVHQYRVATNCSSATSPYSAIKNFTTVALPPCTAPTSLASSSITTSSAVITFAAVSSAASYTLQYKTSASTTWTSVTLTSTTHTLTGLAPGTVYQYRVATNCSSATSSYSAIKNFTTVALPPCTAPTSSSATDITTSSAIISFPAVSVASSYILEYKTALSTTWTSFPISSSTYVLTGLLPSTSYQYRIATVCGSLSSPFTPINSFTTASMSDYCISRGNVSANEYINMVQMDTVSSISGDNGGYADFVGDVTVSTNVGSTVNFTLKPGYSGAMTPEYWRIFVDYNYDGDFIDAGEQVYEGMGIGTLSSYFSIPASISPGAKRMRVSMKNGSYPTPCEIFDFGEVEDYRLNVGPSIVCNNITLNLKLDNLPNETSWNIKNMDGIVVASGSGYSTPSELISSLYCLSNGCYTFSIYDSNSDGLCCSYGSGYYNIYNGSTLLLSGGSFGASISHEFCLPTPTFASMPTAESISIDELTVSPNPIVGDIATLTLISKIESSGVVKVMDNMGRMVMSIPTSISIGKNSITLNTHDLKSGIYTVIIVGEKFNFVDKLMVNK